MTTYEKIKELCENAGFSISSLSQKIPALSVNKASITGWKKGSKPRPEKIKAIADYFGVPVSYFDEGEKQEKKISPAEKISEGERVLLDLFRSLSDEKKEMVIAMLRAALQPKG